MFYNIMMSAHDILIHHSALNQCITMHIMLCIYVLIVNILYTLCLPYVCTPCIIAYLIFIHLYVSFICNFYLLTCFYMTVKYRHLGRFRSLIQKINYCVRPVLLLVYTAYMQTILTTCSHHGC